MLSQVFWCHSLVTILSLVTIIYIDHSVAYKGGHSWGYKAEIHHPAKHENKYNDDKGGGYAHVEHYQSYGGGGGGGGGPSHSSHYYNPHKRYHHHDHGYHFEEPYHYRHKPHYKMSYKSYKEPKEPPPKTTTPEPKKDDDEGMKMNFKFEIPFKGMFDKFEKKEKPKEEEKEEPEEPEEEMYGYGKKKKKPKTTTPPPEEKKEFEIKIPKIDIEGMMGKFGD